MMFTPRRHYPVRHHRCHQYNVRHHPFQNERRPIPHMRIPGYPPLSHKQKSQHTHNPRMSPMPPARPFPIPLLPGAIQMNSIIPRNAIITASNANLHSLTPKDCYALTPGFLLPTHAPSHTAAPCATASSR